MQEFYCYGDVHNHVSSARAFLRKFKPSKVIWLGDFTDSFGDTFKHSRETGAFLRNIIKERPQDVFILSNHDISYRFDGNRRFQGWGWSPEKNLNFHQLFPREFWQKFKLFHKEEIYGKSVFFTHAGLKSFCFPFGVFDEKHLARISEIALAEGNNPDAKHPLLDDVRGPLWTRWPLPIYEPICQVVGHTPCSEPLLVAKGDAWNLCLDCAHTFAAKFTQEGVYSVNIKNGNEKLLINNERKEKRD